MRIFPSQEWKPPCCDVTAQMQFAMFGVLFIAQSRGNLTKSFVLVTVIYVHYNRL